MAPLCRFWARGDCRNGERCKFDHPRDIPQNNNRFAALQTPENSPRGSYGRSPADGRSAPPQNPSSSLNRDTIIADLSTERPQWILSAYGPAPKAAAQLFGGPVREQSFEEMRLHHYNGLSSGNPAVAIQQADALVQEAESQMRNALSNVDGAIDFIQKAENEHPNRDDICQSSTTAPGSIGAASSNSFAGGRGGFTQPAPASSFGQPSALGAKPNPFGAASQRFGQPSQPGSTGTFGQPSILGQKPNPFAAPSGGATPGYTTSSAPAPFAAFATATNPFGGSPQPAAPNPFQQPNQPSKPNPFGQPAPVIENRFSQNAARPNPFGQPTNQPQLGIFGVSSTPTPFGVPSPAAQRNPFGGPSLPTQGNPFVPTSMAATPSNPFGQPAITPVSNPFSQTEIAPSDQQSKPFASSIHGPAPAINGVPGQGPYAPNAAFQHPPLQNYASQDGNRRLTMFKGKPVVYKDDEAGIRNQDGTWEKIWFPDGPPAYYGPTELDDDAYDEDTKAAYLYLRETGSFKDGIIPLLAPKREWCLWDF